MASDGGIAVGQLRYDRRRVPVRPVRLLPRPVQLAGREALLADLRERFAADAGSPVVVALCGLGGVGKSSVALEYAHRFQHEYALVWQVSAEQPTTLTAELTELANLLGLHELMDRGDPVLRLHAGLAARADRWLLVLDNVIDPEAVRRVIPPAGNGRVLITTQYSPWPIGQHVDVPVLEPELAVSFLLTHTRDTDRTAALALAEELGLLPLALAQAGAYLETTGRSLGQYRQLLAAHRRDVLGRGQVSGYDKRVATTWAVAFAELSQSAPAAAGLLRLLSCFAAEAIPVDRLLAGSRPAGIDDQVAAVLAPLWSQPMALDDAVTALRRFSLISPVVRGTASVHRLVQAVTVDALSPEARDRWRAAAAAIIEGALPADRKDPSTWPVFAELLPHATAALSLDAAGMSRAASYLGYSGDYQGARRLWRQIHQAETSARGPEHPDTLTARANLAYWTGQAGDAAAARDQYATLLPIHERVLGPEHPDTLTARGNLADWTGQAGDAAAARDQYATLLPIHERVSGPEHPDTLTGHANLAYYTGAAGDAAAGRDQFAALLPTHERVSGPEHPDTLTTRANLAYWTGQAGDAAAARDQFAALLPISERVSGPEHPDTLTDRANLGYWTEKAQSSPRQSMRLNDHP